MDAETAEMDDLPPDVVTFSEEEPTPVKPRARRSSASTPADKRVGEQDETKNKCQAMGPSAVDVGTGTFAQNVHLKAEPLEEGGEAGEVWVDGGKGSIKVYATICIGCFGRYRKRVKVGKGGKSKEEAFNVAVEWMKQQRRMLVEEKAGGKMDSEGKEAERVGKTAGA
eukprot:15436562-Alexandrium_andersonii.AAC.1